MCFLDESEVLFALFVSASCWSTVTKGEGSGASERSETRDSEWERDIDAAVAFSDDWRERAGEGTMAGDCAATGMSVRRHKL